MRVRTCVCERACGCCVCMRMSADMYVRVCVRAHKSVCVCVNMRERACAWACVREMLTDHNAVPAEGQGGRH